MNTADLIGHAIKDIFVWSKTEVDGMDVAEVFIQLGNGKIISIPWDFDSNNIECSISKDVESIFTNLNDYPVYYINPQGKTIEEIQTIIR